jgi:mono/diheme cytochrome c family protein
MNWALACLALLFVVRPPPRDAIRIFTRGAADDRLVPVSSLALVEVDQYDAQYEQRFPFRGIRLRDVLLRHEPPPSADTALLHFANGMIIPLPFRDETAMERLDPFVAVAIKIGEGKRAWTRHFPALSRENEEYTDIRPTTFAWNKLVVKQRWHPYLPAGVASTFSPWMYADTLVAIEFVAEEPYFRQFDIDHAPETHQGFEIFRQTCAFCHGARNIGAKFGSDMVWPRPIYEYQRPFARFYFHVTFRAPDAAQHGLMMPALSHMTREDARDVWLWLQVIARRNMPEYGLPNSDRRIP